MADGDYERGRGREIGAIAAELKRLAAARLSARSASGPYQGTLVGSPRRGDRLVERVVSNARPPVFVLNGWAASSHAWDLCGFMRPQQVADLPRLFSYVEQLDGEPEKAIESVDRCILVGWSMGGSSALRLAARWPEKVVGLVLIAATPRMMEEKESGWKGMSPRRLEALRYGVMMTHGEGFFGVPEGKPNPYCVDCDENLARGLKYLLETDVRADLERAFSGDRLSARSASGPYQKSASGPYQKSASGPYQKGVYIFHSERDGIVRPENAAYLHKVFPQASVTMVPGTEHALSIFIPELIDEAVDSCLRLAAAGQDIA